MLELEMEIDPKSLILGLPATVDVYQLEIGDCSVSLRILQGRRSY